MFFSVVNSNLFYYRYWVEKLIGVFIVIVIIVSVSVVIFIRRKRLQELVKISPNAMEMRENTSINLKYLERNNVEKLEIMKHISESIP